MSPADAALYEQSYDDYLQQKRDDLDARRNKLGSDPSLNSML